MQRKLTDIFNLNLRWFIAGMLLANIGSQMAYSMLSLYLVNLGASVGQVGLVYTVASVVPMALQLFGGWLSDTIGRLRAIAIGSTVAVVGYALFFISPSWQWVMVGLCIEYVSSAFVAPSWGAYISEQSQEAERGRVFGVANGIYLVVTVIGPALAGIMVQRLGFRPMLMAAFALYASATAVRIWMARAEQFAPTRAAERPTFTKMKTEMLAMAGLLFAGGILTWIWITDAISDTSFTLIGDLYPIYLSNVGHLLVAQVGLLASAWGLASIAGSFSGGWLTDRYSERAIIALGFVFISLGLVCMVMSGALAWFLLARVLGGFGLGLLMPAYNLLISKVVPEDKRGLAFGVFGSSLGILSLPMPWIGAQLWEHIAPQAPFWVTAAVCAIAAPITLLKFRVAKAEQPIHGLRGETRIDTEEEI